MLIYKLDKFDICQFLFGNNNRALPFDITAFVEADLNRQYTAIVENVNQLKLLFKADNNKTIAVNYTLAALGDGISQERLERDLIIGAGRVYYREKLKAIVNEDTAHSAITPNEVVLTIAMSRSREIELDEMLDRLLAFIKNNELIYYARKTSDVDLYYKKQLENKIRLFLYKLSYSNSRLMKILTKDESFVNKILDRLFDDIEYEVKPSIYQYIPDILTVLQKNIINMDIPYLNNKVIYASIKEILPDDKLLFETNIDKLIEVNQNYILETVMESTS